MSHPGCSVHLECVSSVTNRDIIKKFSEDTFIKRSIDEEQLRALITT